MNSIDKRWRIIVIGGHTRSIGKTQLVCDIISAIPEANWIAGKITQYGHGFCVKKGKFCDCAPTEHVCALTWENGSHPHTDSGRFLTAGARRSFWLRTKQGYLSEGFPLLRAALQECKDEWQAEAQTQSANLILESNTFLDFVQPSLYLMVLDSTKPDFKQSARLLINRASAFVLRQAIRGNHADLDQVDQAIPWSGLASLPLQTKPTFLHREGDALPLALSEQVRGALRDSQGIQV